MDNLPVHKAAGVRSAIEAAGCQAALSVAVQPGCVPAPMGIVEEAGDARLAKALAT
jgi:hypothetical protein